MPTFESPFIPIFFRQHCILITSAKRIISRDNFRENVKETSINRRHVCIYICESSRSYTFVLIFLHSCRNDDVADSPRFRVYYYLTEKNSYLAKLIIPSNSISPLVITSTTLQSFPRDKYFFHRNDPFESKSVSLSRTNIILLLNQLLPTQRTV